MSVALLRLSFVLAVVFALRTYAQPRSGPASYAPHITDLLDPQGSNNVFYPVNADLRGQLDPNDVRTSILHSPSVSDLTRYTKSTEHKANHRGHDYSEIPSALKLLKQTKHKPYTRSQLTKLEAYDIGPLCMNSDYLRETASVLNKWHYKKAEEVYAVLVYDARDRKVVELRRYMFTTDDVARGVRVGLPGKSYPGLVSNVNLRILHVPLQLPVVSLHKPFLLYHQLAYIPKLIEVIDDRYYVMSVKKKSLKCKSECKIVEDGHDLSDDMLVVKLPSF
eukprot:Lankesteria_metandrocarpae@DN731_c0_g1_i1.p1